MHTVDPRREDSRVSDWCKTFGRERTRRIVRMSRSDLPSSPSSQAATISIFRSLVTVNSTWQCLEAILSGTALVHTGSQLFLAMYPR